MIATIDEKIATRVRELAFFDVLHPRSVHANGNIVFGFARHGAGMAANALALVDDKGVFRHVGFPLVGDEKKRCDYWNADCNAALAARLLKSSLKGTYLLLSV
jgi:hypothetical protein